MASVGALFLALVVIIVFLLNAPERRYARDRRISAVHGLLGKGFEDGPDGLESIASYVASPISGGGGLDNLGHFLSKDPGRSRFPRAADRRRAAKYLPEKTAEFLAEYAGGETARNAPEWAREYVADVRFLFEKARDEILVMTGVPQYATAVFSIPETSRMSAADRAEAALTRFSEVWIPPRETASTYSVDKGRIKEELLRNKRFQKRLLAVDDSWRYLAAALYNLSMDPNWRAAVEYDPRLQAELDELTILVVAADIHRRGRDLMAGVPAPSGSSTPSGILWLPDFSYYKNIPEVTGLTADEEPTLYFAKVDLGYTFRDSRTQTWLNRRKDWLTDYMGMFFSTTHIDDFSPVEQTDRSTSTWALARLKAEGIHGINTKIVSSIPFGAKKVYGVRDMSLVRVNMIVNP